MSEKTEALTVGQAAETIICQQCQGKMQKTVLARENSGITALALIVAIVGAILLFVFPIGTIVGVLLLVAAPKIADRSKNVWKCESCGYFFDRA